MRPLAYRLLAYRLLAYRLLAIVVATGLGLAACGGTAAANGTAGIRAFSLIEVGKTSLQIAANGRSAVVRVETSQPTVCAIAFGRTPSLGSIADDPNMGGTAITRHIVVLGGLAPGTTYRFRLTAIDARAKCSRPRSWPPSRRRASGPPWSKMSPSAR